jgi:hypothetical protein
MTLRNALITLLLLGSSSIALAPSEAGPLTSRYGPYTCKGCLLQTPMPDAATLSFIQNSPAFTGMAQGNVITICSATACVSYTKTDGRNFEGGPIQTITQGNPGGGGGGGSGGGGGVGGVNPGGGCYGNCGGGGVVTVGPISNPGGGGGSGGDFKKPRSVTKKPQ